MASGVIAKPPRAPTENLSHFFFSFSPSLYDIYIERVEWKTLLMGRNICVPLIFRLASYEELSDMI